VTVGSVIVQAPVVKHICIRQENQVSKWWVKQFEPTMHGLNLILQSFTTNSWVGATELEIPQCVLTLNTDLDIYYRTFKRKLTWRPLVLPITVTSPRLDMINSNRKLLWLATKCQIFLTLLNNWRYDTRHNARDKTVLLTAKSSHEVVTELGCKLASFTNNMKLQVIC